MHDGHRERMRERAAKSGFDSFHSHEILEMLLYASIPRKDTNVIAHDLINKFGSFSGVLDASYEELLKIKGVGKSTAFMLKLVPVSAATYIKDKYKEGTVISTQMQAFEYLRGQYIDQVEELPSALFLNSKCKLLAWNAIGNGSLKSSDIVTRKLIEQCIKYQATQVLLCHNHPSGVLKPSREDVIATKNIIYALKTIQVKVIDHIIICGDNFLSMASLKEYDILFI